MTRGPNWKEELAKAYEDLQFHLGASGSAYERAKIAAVTSREVVEMLEYQEGSDPDLLERYRDRLEEEHKTAVSARIKAEESSKIGKARLGQAKNTVKINAVEDQKIHPHRSKTYRDLQEDMEAYQEQIKTQAAMTAQRAAEVKSIVEWVV